MIGETDAQMTAIVAPTTGLATAARMTATMTVVVVVLTAPHAMMIAGVGAIVGMVVAVQVATVVDMEEVADVTIAALAAGGKTQLNCSFSCAVAAAICWARQGCPICMLSLHALIDLASMCGTH